MKVYVVEEGCYSEREIVGVFATPERAMAEWPKERFTRNKAYTDELPAWSNDRDFGRALRILTFNVEA